MATRRQKQKKKIAKPFGVAQGRPRAPLPRQTGGAHEDKTKRPWRRRKHKGNNQE